MALMKTGKEDLGMYGHGPYRGWALAGAGASKANPATRVHGGQRKIKNENQKSVKLVVFRQAI